MKTIERVVIDTNVLVSFVLRPFSVPGRAVRHVLDHHDVIVSAAVLDEFRDVIARPKFDRYAPAAKRRRFAVDLRRSAVVVSIVHRVRACADPTDDKFLEAAVNGGVDMILSGDRALLALHPFRGTGIIAPADYLRRAGLAP